MTDYYKQNMAKQTLELIKKGISLNYNKDLLTLEKSDQLYIYKKRILLFLDEIDSLRFNHIDGIYNLAKGCSREEISDYISSLNVDSINNCIGQIQDSFAKLEL